MRLRLDSSAALSLCSEWQRGLVLFFRGGFHVANITPMGSVRFSEWRNKRRVRVRIYTFTPILAVVVRCRCCYSFATFKALRGGLGGHSRKCPPMTFSSSTIIITDYRNGGFFALLPVCLLDVHPVRRRSPSAKITAKSALCGARVFTWQKSISSR